MSTCKDAQRIGPVFQVLASARPLISKLLAGTALSMGFATSALAQVVAPPVEQVDVSAYTVANSGLVKLMEPLLDTPVSATTVTQQLMQDRGDTNLNDVLRNVPSITLQSNESSWMGNAPFIRGFSARTDMFIDG